MQTLVIHHAIELQLELKGDTDTALRRVVLKKICGTFYRLNCFKDLVLLLSCYAPPHVRLFAA